MNNSTIARLKGKKSLFNDDTNKAIESFFYGIVASSIAMGVLYVFASIR